MFPLMTDLPLTPAQVVAATRLMLQIAHVDGARTAEEVTLIQLFYDAYRDAELPAFESLEAEQGAVMVATRDLPEPAHQDMILALCLMVAYADGQLSEAEQAAIGKVAEHLDVTEARLESILAQVKDFMLSQLSGLPDAGSVAVVARELG